MKNTNSTATATSVATFPMTKEAQTRAKRLEKLAKALNTSPSITDALYDVIDAASLVDAEGVTHTLHSALQYITNTVQIAIGEKYTSNDAERVEQMQDLAHDIIDRLGETVFLFGQIIEHYEAVDTLFKAIRKEL